MAWADLHHIKKSIRTFISCALVTSQLVLNLDWENYPNKKMSGKPINL